MGKGASKLRKPKYIKNFNIENEAMKAIDAIEQGKSMKISPRHPSTKEFLRQNEGWLISETISCI